MVGPEALTGSTRLKSGSAQKLVLNMLSTGAMVKLGKVYQNLMVDVKATNVKLVDRACRIVVEATGAERAQAEAALAQTGFEVKPAILMILAGVSAEERSSGCSGTTATCARRWRVNSRWGRRWTRQRHWRHRSRRAWGRG